MVSNNATTVSRGIKAQLGLSDGVGDVISLVIFRSLSVLSFVQDVLCDSFSITIYVDCAPEDNGGVSS